MVIWAEGGPSCPSEAEVVELSSWQAGVVVVELSSWQAEVVVEVPSCPSEAEVVELSSPCLTPHANTESL